MMPESSKKPTSPAPSALDERTNQLLLENVKEKKGDLGDGQKLSDLRAGVEKDFAIENNSDKFQLIKQLETEINKKPETNPVTKATFNEIKDYQSHVQDGHGRGKPPNRDEGKTHD